MGLGSKVSQPGHTVNSRGPNAVHIRAVVVQSWSCKGRVCDALGVETEPWLLWVVLGDWKSTRNQFRLVTVSPAVHVLVWVTLTGCLLALQIGIVKDLVDVGFGLALLDRKVAKLFV